MNQEGSFIKKLLGYLTEPEGCGSSCRAGNGSQKETRHQPDSSSVCLSAFIPFFHSSLQAGFLLCCFPRGKIVNTALEFYNVPEFHPTQRKRPALNSNFMLALTRLHSGAHSCLLCTAGLLALFLSQSILFLLDELHSFHISLRILTRCLCHLFDFQFLLYSLHYLLFWGLVYCFILFSCYSFYSEV